MLMTNEDNAECRNPTDDSGSFPDLINPLLTGLFYPSESDEPVELTTCYLNQTEPLTVSQIKDWLMLPPSAGVEETPEADFWEPVVTEQDWYGDDEKARTAQFGQLKKALETELTGRQVFRVGETEIDVYLLGRPKNGDRAGIKTKIVQT